MRPAILFFALFLAFETSPAQRCDSVISLAPNGDQRMFAFANKIQMGSDTSGLIIDGFVVSKTFVLVFDLIGVSDCIKNRSKINFQFTDTTAIEAVNQYKDNCDRKSATYFAEPLGNLADLETLSSKLLGSITIYRDQRDSIRMPVSRNAETFREHIGCLREVLNVIPPEDTAIYETVEQIAEFPGGLNTMNAFIRKNLTYPPGPRRMGVDGTVYVQFIITNTGKLTEIKVIRGVHKDIDAEAMRVIMMMPMWQPARHRGKPVFSRYVLPIRFKLS
jgi:TonB family protein